jgi:hypothetical protein
MGIDIFPETLPAFGPDMLPKIQYQIIKNFPTKTMGYRTMFTATYTPWLLSIAMAIRWRTVVLKKGRKLSGFGPSSNFQLLMNPSTPLLCT